MPSGLGAAPARSSPTTVPGATMGGIGARGMPSARRISLLHLSLARVHELGHTGPGGIHRGHPAEVVVEERRRAAGSARPSSIEPARFCTSHRSWLDTLKGWKWMPVISYSRAASMRAFTCVDHAVQAVIAVAVHRPEESLRPR